MIVKVMGPEMGEYWMWDGIDKIQVCPIGEKSFVNQFVRGQRGTRSNITKGELEIKAKETLPTPPDWDKNQENSSGQLRNDKTFKVMGSVFEKGKSSMGYSINYQNENQEWCAILFNTIAYICGNDGKTLEVVHG